MNNFCKKRHKVCYDKKRKTTRICAGLLLSVVFLLFSTKAGAQMNPSGQHEIFVKGVVIDTHEEPLLGVNVIQKSNGKNRIGTTTDSNGAFSIKVMPGSKIELSYLGYTTQVITATKSDKTLQIVLEEATEELEEVVVVAYGVQKKVSVTGAVSSIKTSEIKQSPAPNLLGTLAGRLPGLTTIQRGGQPGNEEFQMYLRGASTVNEQNPLVLIDGIPRDNITSIDPNEIESISILKDASSTAIFGVRGANGVILITTRRGSSEGKPQLSVTAEYGLQDRTRDFETVHSWEYAEMRNQALKAEGAAPQFSEHAIEMYKNGKDRVMYPDNNWAEMLFRKSTPMSRVNVNASGGTERVKYFMNMNYLHQGGMFNVTNDPARGYDPQYKMDRYNFRTNLDINASSWIKAAFDIAGYIEKVNTPGSSNGNSDLILASIYGSNPVKYGPLTPEGYGVPAGEIVAYDNSDNVAYGELNRTGYRRNNNSKLNSSLAVNFDLKTITQGLTSKLQVSFDGLSVSGRNSIWSYNRYSGTLSSELNPETGHMEDNLTIKPTATPEYRTPSLGQSSSFVYNVNAQWLLNYNRTFNKKHAVTAMTIAQRDYNESNGGSDLLIPYNRLGFSGRVTYGYDSRYLAEINAGYNGSEQFHKDQRFGFFPAASVGWVISNEEFMKKQSIITNLKVRASYGKVGSDQLGQARFLYMDNVSIDGGGFSGSIGEGKWINEKLIGNQALTWEIAYKQNYGLEVAILNDLRLNADLFFEKRENVLINRNTIPSIQGIPLGVLPKANIGKISNKGFELELIYSKQINKDFRFSVKGNFNYNRNVIDYADEAPLDDSYPYKYTQTGYQIGQNWGYQIDWASKGKGYFTSQEEIDNCGLKYVGVQPLPGDFIYKDLNGDNMIDDHDKAPTKYGWIPRINYGATLTVNWKGFDFSALIQGVGQTSKYYSSWGIYETAGGKGMYYAHHRTAWTPERFAAGEEITGPRLGVVTGTSSMRENDFYIMDRSFVRLKNMELGYTLPSTISKYIYAQRIRVYANGNNLFTWDKRPFKNFDPELDNPLKVPITRTFNFGINVVF